MAQDTKKDEYLLVHGHLDTPCAFAFSEPDTSFLDHWSEICSSPLTRDDDSPSPFAILLAPASVCQHTNGNLTCRFQNAEVEIMLSPIGTDDLLLPAELLIRHSPWFKTALSDRWLFSGDLQEHTRPATYARPDTS